MLVVAIIAAGGRGERLGAGVPKQWLRLGDRTILERSVGVVDASPRVDEIIAVVPQDLVVLASEHLRRVTKPVQVVSGGPRRQDSVANAFAHVRAEADVVVIHDAARPFVTGDLIDRTITAAVEDGAAIAAILARDTVKHVEQTGDVKDVKYVGSTLARDAIYLAQTPQAFRRNVLQAAVAFGRAGGVGTDEAALAEQAGHRVRLIEGDRRNIKITTPEDLAFARALMGPEDAGLMRVGTGYDLHRLVDHRPLVLGGVTIPFDKGLAGHSDADALSHAVTDAILGAAAVGDIGQHFPDADPQWRGASSLDLLGRAAALVDAAGFRIANVDAVVVAERPTIAPYVARMRQALAAAMRIEAARVSVKGKTGEGIGEIGRGEAIACHAVALVLRAVE